MIGALVASWLFASAAAAPPAAVAAKDRSAAVAGAIQTIAHGLTSTKYQHRISVDTRKGIYNWDCSIMAAWIVERAAPVARHAIGAEKPLARDFYRALARAPIDRPARGWQRLPDIAALEPGDLFAWLKPEMFKERANTGHVGFAVGKPWRHPRFADIWLVLDLDARMMAGRGVESVEEYAVTICASLAKYFLDENRAVGFAAQGLHLTPDRGTRQLLKIYEVLAFVRPVSGTPLAELLVAEQRRFSRTDTVVVVTGSREDDWVSIMRSLSLRGVHGQAVQLEASTFGRVPSSLTVLGALAAARIPTYVVKRGESIQRALAAPAVGSRGVPV